MSTMAVVLHSFPFPIIFYCHFNFEPIFTFKLRNKLTSTYFCSRKKLWDLFFSCDYNLTMIQFKEENTTTALPCAGGPPPLQPRHN